MITRLHELLRLHKKEVSMNPMESNVGTTYAEVGSVDGIFTRNKNRLRKASNLTLRY